MENLKFAVINKCLLTKEDTATLEKMASDGKIVSQDWRTAELEEHQPVVYVANKYQHDLVEFLLEYGVEKIKEVITPSLDKHFSVKFEIEDWDYLHNAQYEDGLLFMPDLIFSIPLDTPLRKSMEFVSQVGIAFCTDTFTLKNNYLEFRCYAGEGLPVEKISHIIYGINDHLGPNIKEVLKRLEIDNYHVTFIVMQRYSN